MMFALWSSPNRIQINAQGLIKKVTHLRPIYLNWYKEKEDTRPTQIKTYILNQNIIAEWN